MNFVGLNRGERIGLLIVKLESVQKVQEDCVCPNVDSEDALVSVCPQEEVPNGQIHRV